MRDAFNRFARRVADACGRPWAFALAFALVVGWLALGPVFAFSDSWSLLINTVTTIITFLMVFLIQNTQNHDAKAMHLKLDELLRAAKGARTALVDLEEFTEQELDQLQQEFRELQKKYKVTDRVGAARDEIRGGHDAKH